MPGGYKPSQQIKLWGVNSTLNLAGTEDRDFYKVVAPRCGVLNITASNIGAGAATSQDIQFTVYQPDTLTQIGSAGTGSCDAAAISGAFLVQPGIVYIKVDDNTGNLNCQGGYDLSNTPFTLTFAYDTTDMCECNNSFATACEVNINSSQQVKLWGVNSNLNLVGIEDRDFYKVIAPVCGVLNITASNIGGGAATSQDIQFTIYQPDTLTQIGSAGTGSCDAATISGVFLVQPGIVYIKVDDNTGNLNCQGGYDLSNTPFTLTFGFLPSLLTPTIGGPNSVAACAGDVVILSSSSATHNNWSTGDTTQQINFVANQNVWVTLRVDSGGCFSGNDSVFVTVAQKPHASFSNTSTGLTSHFIDASSNASSFTWNFGDNSSISSQQNPTHTYVTPGTYSVILTSCNGNCCDDTSMLIGVVSGITELDLNKSISIYPNPTNNTLFITSTSQQLQTLAVYNLSGQKLLEQSFTPQIDVTNLTNGVYFIEVKSKEDLVRKRFLKM